MKTKGIVDVGWRRWPELPITRIHFTNAAQKIIVAFS
jgi:hypothetical protein